MLILSINELQDNSLIFTARVINSYYGLQLQYPAIIYLIQSAGSVKCGCPHFIFDRQHLVLGHLRGDSQFIIDTNTHVILWNSEGWQSAKNT